MITGGVIGFLVWVVLIILASYSLKANESLSYERSLVLGFLCVSSGVAIGYLVSVW